MRDNDIHGRLSRLIFSGEFETGSNLVERDLADRLGVSRVPVRETLYRLVAQGSLEGGRKGEGVRIRRYSPDQIRQLYDFRAVIEGGIARSAAQAATAADILQMSLICDQMESLLDQDDSESWGTIDGKFHEALAESAHNERFERTLKSLLEECFYVFYILSRRRSRKELTTEEFILHKQQALDDHRAVVQLIQDRQTDQAEARLRLHILRSADRVIRAFIVTELGT